MTKEEFLKEHQNNEELIKELDEIIGVLKTCDDQIPYFAIHMKQLGQDLYSYHEYTVITKRHKDLLSILVDIGIVDKFPSRHKDETSTYKIKTSQKFSKTLLEQLNNWKNEQQQKSQPNIVENYTNSIVNKDSKIHKSDLRFLNATNADTNTPKENPKQNVAIGNKLISKFFEFWWLVIIGLIIGAIILNIEYKWFVNEKTQ